MTSLRTIKKEWKDCNDCGLGATARHHVFYRGSVPCDVLFCGEAPGKDEDLLGEPFVGRAGDVLNALIWESKKELCDRGYIDRMELETSYKLETRFTYGITNILACRPTSSEGKDRPPTKAEAKACSPRLRDTILTARPKLIILLGRSAETYYKMQDGVASCPVVYLEHPAFILRNGGIGSVKFQSVLLRLVEALERHLYGSPSVQAQEAPKSRRKAQKAR